MAPTEALHVTPALGVTSFETVAANVCVAPATIATGVVVMATLIGGADEPPHPTMRANAVKPANTRESRRTFDMWFTIIPKRLGADKLNGYVQYKAL